MITATVHGQSLRIAQPVVAADTIEYLEISFDFQTADWADRSIWALFSQSGEPYKVNLHDGKILKSDNLNLSVGQWSVWLLGVAADGSRITTTVASLEVEPTGALDGEPLGEIPLSAAEQIDQKAQAAMLTAAEAKEEAEKAGPYAEAARKSAEAAEDASVAAQSAEQSAKTQAANSKASAESSDADAQAAAQALKDLLRMMGTDIATLVGGKIPVDQIPSIATTEIYFAASKQEQEAQKAETGDILIRTDENKSYIWKDTGWVYLASPTDFAAKAGYAETAGTAENANKINGHRLVQITRSEWESAVKDPETYYLIYDPEAEK